MTTPVPIVMHSTFQKTNVERLVEWLVVKPNWHASTSSADSTNLAKTNSKS
jgi:hypothetical protein